MKNKTPITLLAATAGLLLSLPAQTNTNNPPAASSATAPVAFGAEESGSHPLLDRLQKFGDKLGLNDAQKEQVKGLVRKYREPVQYQVGQVVDARRKLRTLINTVPTDEPAIRAQSSVMAGAQTELAVTMAHVSADVQAILTPEQIAKAKSARERMESFVDKVRNRIHTWLQSF